MIEKNTKIFSFCLYFLCAVSLLIFLYLDFFAVNLSRAFKISVTAAVFIFAYSGSFLRCKSASSDAACNIMYNTFFFLFTVYIVVVADFTLIDGAFGRTVSVFFAKSPQARREYLKTGVNLIPFATVKLFIKGYKNGVLSLADISDNILGNFLALAPLAFFVPVYLKRINRLYKYFLLVLSIVLLIELLQIFFMTGAADIDDVILNIAGAIIFYGIIRIKGASKILSAATFKLWESER